MPTFFLIAPYEPQTWTEAGKRGEIPIGDLKIEPNTYGQSLLQQWPLATNEPVLTGSAYMAHWLLPTGRIGFGGFRVSLWRNLQVVSFDTGPKEVFLEFILWRRRFVPFVYRLFLFDSVSPTSLELRPNVEAQEVVGYTKIMD